LRKSDCEAIPPFPDISSDHIFSITVYPKYIPMIIFCQVVVRLRAGEIIIVFIRATYQTAVLFIIEQLQGGRFGRVEPLVKTAPHRRVVVHQRPGRRGAPYVISRKKGNREGDAELLLAQPHDQFVRLGGNNLIPPAPGHRPAAQSPRSGEGEKTFLGIF